MGDCGDGESLSRRNSSGKRFVRRARRWAELQQKRQVRRNSDESEFPSVPCEPHFRLHNPSQLLFDNQHSHHRVESTRHNYRPPEPPHIYDYLEIANLDCGVMLIDGDVNNKEFLEEAAPQKQNLGHTQSFPITILQSKHFGTPPGYSYSYSQKHLTCQRTGSSLRYYQNYQQPMHSQQHSSWRETQKSLRGSRPDESALTLITNDLSTTSISDASTTSPSSISNNSEEDVPAQYFNLTTSLPKSSRSTIPKLSSSLYISHLPRKSHFISSFRITRRIIGIKLWEQCCELILNVSNILPIVFIS